MIREAVALALGASACFGTALVLTQGGLRHMPARHGALVSVPTSALLLVLLAPIWLDLGGWDWRGAAVFAAVGLLFPAAVTLLTFEANRLMGPSVAGALGNLAPLFAVLVAALLLGELPRLWQLAGIVAIVGGVVALTVDRSWLNAAWPLWAMMLPLGAAAIRGLVQPVIKLGLGFWPSAFAAVLLGYAVSALVLLGTAAVRMPPRRAELPRIGLCWFMCVGICNGAAVLTMYAALARGPVALVSPLVATYPLVTMALAAMLWRSSRPSGGRLAGVALTVLGVALLLAA